MAPAHLEVAPEAGREADAYRLDDRVDEVGLAEALEVGDRRLEAVEVLGRVGDEHGRRALVLGKVAVGPVEAEDIVDARDGRRTAPLDAERIGRLRAVCER